MSNSRNTNINNNPFVIIPDPGTETKPGDIWGAGAIEKTYEVNRFDPSTADSDLSYTPGRVAKNLFNHYEPIPGFEVFGYLSDWGIYDSRYGNAPGDTNVDYKEGGRGTNIMRLLDENSPLPYFDRIVVGFAGIIGDEGLKKETINQAAIDFKIASSVGDLPNHKGEATFTDYWGDTGAYLNCGFPGWKETDFTPENAQGVLGALVKLHKKYPEMPIGLSLGGWSMSQAFHFIAKEPELRQRLAKSLKKIFDLFPMFTDLDIDWEYPNYKGEDHNSYDEEDPENFAELIKEIRKELPDITISIATIAVPAGLEAANIPLLLEAGVDKLNVMTYDFFGTPWAETLGHHTALKLNPDKEETQNSVDKAVNYLVDKLHVEPKKINIGYAGYTRNAQQASIPSISPIYGRYTPRGNIALGSFESGTTEWPDLLRNYLDSNMDGINGFTVYTDEVAKAEFLYNQESRLFMSLDTPYSVKEKAKYVKEKGLGGMFIWMIDHDNGLLTNAAREGLGATTVGTPLVDMTPLCLSAAEKAKNKTK
ncbi:chitinase [Xenorhabdus sp. DI]|uniref:glycosyl hydrolase family 18 protein n=1 Tax=Xenorhabdus doucetiae TaxID=351671 RepID=UPI0019CA9560|nr:MULTISPECIES: glycosyl hydrolase family 18 protein [unclassified Xenorhabdus]MBD2784174.1 chitinase [Xenorhabdus sp. 3]MBD2789609.1 chitinase [Xenorhabdus sp. DI]